MAPCRREEEPGEQRRVAVGVSVVGGAASRDEARGVREDEVVDVGVFHGRVGVLEEAVEEENDAQEDCEAEDGGRGGE